MIGVIKAPMLLPELNSPVANARSRRGCHSLTALTAAGKLPPSANPNPIRAAAKPSTVPNTNTCPEPRPKGIGIVILRSTGSRPTNPWATAATLHTPTANANPNRTPIRSNSRPDSR